MDLATKKGARGICKSLCRG
ncbi:hypothetical protein LINPERHAP2_LOCUS15621 [Linum perenne]